MSRMPTTGAERLRILDGEDLDPDAQQGPAPKPLDPALVEAVTVELGVEGGEAQVLATELAQRIQRTQLERLARRTVDQQQAEREQRLELIVALTAAEFLDQDDDEVVPLLGNLASEGHNVSLTGGFKVGKSTLEENAIASLVTAAPFLGRFNVSEPKRVVLLNHELTPADQRARLRALNLGGQARERLAVVNLRGKRLAITTPSGRAHLVGILRDHGADVVFIDPWGVSMAHAGLSENENDDARRWTTALDEIKDIAGCPTAFVPAHTGRAEKAEGAEHARGATALDDWADVRIVLTRTPTGDRFIYSNGRAVDLVESRLTFDETTRLLSVDYDDLGLGRRQAQAVALVGDVEAIVTAAPGCTARAIEDSLAADGAAKDNARAAIKAAVRRGVVHFHEGPRRAHLHHLGQSHHATEPCPEESR